MKTSMKSAAFRNTAIVFLFVLPTPLRAQDPVVLEGKFGKAEVNVAKPAISSLTLRRADGSLEPHSLLSPKGAAWLHGVPDWGTQALTFAVDEAGKRFESRMHAPEAVEKSAEEIILRGVVLSDGVGQPVAREDSTLETTGDELMWTVERTWLKNLTTTSAGTPAVFFSNRPISNNPSTILPNSVATTFWIEPEKLRGWFNPFYRLGEFNLGYKLSLENNVVVTEPGGWAVLTRFGYNTPGSFTDDNIIQIIGGRAYYLYSGDLDFVRQQLPFYRRAVAWYLSKRNADGLVSLNPAHWYYDAMGASGVTFYHNAFLYRALVDLAGLENAAGNPKEAAATCQAEAAKLKEAFNRVLWWEDAPGGPRYVDWITPNGTKIAYGADLCLFPPVAFGIATADQAKKKRKRRGKRALLVRVWNWYVSRASASF